MARRRWLQRALSSSVDNSVVGKTGRVTGAVGPGLVGEVMVTVRGGSEAFNAYPFLGTETFGLGELVVIVEYADPRIVYVSAAR